MGKGSSPEHLGQAGCTSGKAVGEGPGLWAVMSTSSRRAAAWVLRVQSVGLRPDGLWVTSGWSLAVSVGSLALSTPPEGTFTIVCKTQEDSQSEILFENLKPSTKARGLFGFPWVAGIFQHRA